MRRELGIRERGIGNREQRATHREQVPRCGPRRGTPWRALTGRGLSGGLHGLAFLFAVALLISHPASAQVATGFPPFGSFGGGPFDTIDNANLNVHFAIPIINKAGRGLAFDYAVTYDSSIWYTSGSSWVPVAGMGWGGTSQVGTGYVNYSLTQGQCVVDAHPYYYNVLSSWYYYDAQGTSHSFTGLSVSNGNTTPCPSNDYPPSSGSATVADGSGWEIQVQVSSAGYPSSVTVWSLSGVKYNPPLGTGTPSSGTYTLTDPNGNVIQFTAPGSYTDTLGTSVLSIQGSPSSGSVTYVWSPPGSGTGKVTFIYSQKTVQTNFGCSGVSEYGATKQYMVTEIDLPDNSGTNPDKYTISYEATPGHTSNTTGRLASVTLPTGGQITYSYTGGGNGIMCPSGGTVTMNRGTPDGAWTYVLEADYPPEWETVVTDPQGNNTDYGFSGIYEASRMVTQAGYPLENVNTCYNGAAVPCTGTAVTLPITQITTITNLGGEESKTNASYMDSLVTLLDEYDFGSGSPGSFLRETMTCYAPIGYVQNKPFAKMVYNVQGQNPSNCSGTTGLAAETTYGYDSNGNLLTETRTNTGGSPSSVSRSFTYSTTAPIGVLQTSTDFNGNKTSYTNTACNNSFPTTVTLPITSLTYELTWNCNGGVVTSIEDPNQRTTTYQYGDANFWRLTGIGYPDGGNTTYTYIDTQGAFSVETSQLLSTGVNHQVTQYLDGLGRVDETMDSQGCSQGQAASYVYTHYDGLGRLYTLTNPYCTTSDPTYGLTTYGYDALNRPNSLEAPDGSTTLTTYPGNCATATDPAGKARTLCSDGLGRITSVTEDPNGLDYQTTYTYNLLNDLTGVAQGSQTRTYNYDMLGHLTSVKTPEVSLPNGTQCSTTYGYDANGNVTSKTAPLENQNSSCSSTVTTTYGYDALNRLTSKAYSDSTPPANFFYDQTAVGIGNWTSPILSNPRGRMTEATTTLSGSVKTAVVYSYDPVGRIKSYWQCNPSNCGTSGIYNMQYDYDLAGDVTSWTHPGQISLINTVDSAQQITQVQTTSQFTNLPQTLVQNIAYTAFGAVSTLENGCAGTGCVNALETYQYNKQLQPAVIELGTTSNASADYCLVYNYYASSPTSCALPSPGTNDNGNVMGYLYGDSVNSSYSHTATYTYDGVNRLLTAVATPFGSGTVSYNLNFNSYDRYGNMTCVQNSNTNGPCPQWTYNTSNQLATSTGCTYDAAGNTTKDCSTAHTYQWDAEGRVSSVDNGALWAFTYNALGHRVQWSYSNGSTLNQQMFDPNGGWLGVYGTLDVLRWGDGAYAWYTGTETYFNHINNISSTTMLTNHSGAAAHDILYYPWGQTTPWQQSGGGGANFAELPYQDGNSGTNIALYRLQSPGLGRWLSPDPVAGNPSNPQSWNRYSYVLNNPTSLVDPLGLSNTCPPGAPPGSCNPQQLAQSNECADEEAGEVVDASCGGGGGGGLGSSTPIGVDPGGNVFGYNIWDALENAPGTYIDANGNWGFSIDQWHSYWAAQTSYQFSWTGVDRSSIREQQRELAAIQVGLAQCPDCDPDELKVIIQLAYDNMTLAKQLGNGTGLVGGNYNFELAALDLAPGRYGDIDSLHVHSDLTFHVDTANPFNFFLAPIHLAFDFIGGKTWWAGGIPRPWWQ